MAHLNTLHWYKVSWLAALLIFILLLLTSPISHATLIMQDSEVVDTKQKLVWQLCPEGLVPQKTNCTGQIKQFSWHQATQYAFAADQAIKWRLPTKQELITYLKQVVSLEKVNQSKTVTLPTSTLINSTYPSFYWTKTQGNGYQSGAWGVHAATQSGRFYFRKKTGWLLLVRDQESSAHRKYWGGL